ncbi:histidine kinase [Fictibacillus sp. KIGAM418]|uniref:histidine kinase n=1 Tax=Fictibacillus marinisediminis TaxID=2878389 RepID=A0A9X1XE05_9BACL|nr:ATP-binding protein [Fictibacillus marinisediminis]MCK6259069.1 histidine kinase [Fictibacillus marinisediminis]
MKKRKIQLEKVTSYIIQSQEAEIKRIALELHEGIGQTLYSIYTGLQYIQTGLEKPHLTEYAQEISQSLERTIKEIRLLSVELHPPTLTTLGLLPAMKSFSKLFTSTFGIEVEIASAGKEQRVTEAQSVTLFRVCQEALTNAAKYADTSFIKIDFTWKENCLKIAVKDFGKGFFAEEPALQQSPGLQAMKERMKLAGGHCRITSEAGMGTVVEMQIPL